MAKNSRSKSEKTKSASKRQTRRVSGQSEAGESAMTDLATSGIKNKGLWIAGGLALVGAGAFAAAALLRNKEGDAAVSGTPSLFMKIRAAVEKFANQPDLVRVHLKNGIATLEGHVQLDEIEELVAAVEKIPGLSKVVNSLETHEAPNTSNYHS